MREHSIMSEQAIPLFALWDTLRRAQAEALGLLGFGPSECACHVLASGPYWRLRAYGCENDGPCVLIIAAPIKRPYVWDLAPHASAVRYCQQHGLRIFLLEWIPRLGEENGGVDAYADHAIHECVAAVTAQAPGKRPFLMGHSLGGTLAAIFAALEPESLQGLVLLGAPLCFQPQTSRFRDALVSIIPPSLPNLDVFPGSLLSQVSAMASPDTFVWSRLKDAMQSVADLQAMDIHARVERWTLDEVPLPGKLFREIVQWLYRENRLCTGTLPVRGTVIGPSRAAVPTLAVINTQDEVAPAASVVPFLEAMPTKDVRLIQYSGEVGVALQHIGILVGRKAYAQVWPEIIAWIQAHRS